MAFIPSYNAADLGRRSAGPDPDMLRTRWPASRDVTAPKEEARQTSMKKVRRDFEEF